MARKTDNRDIFEKFFGKKICSEKLNIEGFNSPIPFDIYDGYAVCENHKGHRYDMAYPQLKIVKASKELSNAVMEYVGGIECVDDINVLHVLMTFNTCFVDGVEVVPN